MTRMEVPTESSSIGFVPMFEAIACIACWELLIAVSYSLFRGLRGATIPCLGEQC